MLWVIVLLAIVLPACSGAQRTSGSNLQSVVERFHHDLRWHYRDDAAARVHPRYTSDFLDILDAEKDDLHFTHWEVRRVRLEPDGKKAHLRINMRYYRMPSTVVQDDVVKQEWNLIHDQWLLVRQEGGPYAFPSELEHKEDKDKGRPDTTGGVKTEL